MSIQRDILMLAHVQYPAEVRVRREVEALLGGGYTVHLICLQGQGQPAREIRGNLEVIRLPFTKTRRNVLTYLWEYFSFVCSATFLVTWLYMKHNYRLVQVYNQPDFLVFSALVPKLFGAKIILDFRDAMPEGTMDKFGLAENHPVVRLLRFVERISMKYAHCILTVHRPFKNLLISRGFDSTKIGIFVNLPDPQLFDREQYPTLNKPTNEQLRLFHHGTLNEVYNVGLVLEALALLNEWQLGGAVRLTIYGTGPDLVYLQKKTELLNLDNVYFKGRVPLECIPGLIAEQADAGVVPTRSGPVGNYSLSNKLLEYAVMGKPVIASNLPTFRSVFGENSLLFFESNSAKELAHCIVRLLKDTQLRQSLVESADIDLAKFSWQVNQQQYLDFVVSALVS